MSKPASNPTRLNREATLAKYRRRQHSRDAMGIGVIAGVAVCGALFWWVFYASAK